jgi:hypothetical protein
MARRYSSLVIPEIQFGFRNRNSAAESAGGGKGFSNTPIHASGNFEVAFTVSAESKAGAAS